MLQEVVGRPIPIFIEPGGDGSLAVGHAWVQVSRVVVIQVLLERV